jgi:hypothetical protein
MREIRYIVDGNRRSTHGEDAMSLIPTDKFEQNDPLEGESMSTEVVRNDRVAANVSPINEATPARRGRSTPERVESSPIPPRENARINGSPLPVGTGGNKTKETTRGSSPGRSLAVPSEPQDDISGAQRALNAMKQALPLVQKLLPLLDGNVLAVVGNLLAPRPQAHQALDLAPLESHMTEMQLMHHDLRSKVTEQNTSLRRVEDQLEMVKEATDRNTLEQQELLEDLRSLGNKFNLFAALIFGLLIVSVILNLLLFMHLKQALP